MQILNRSFLGGLLFALWFAQANAQITLSGASTYDSSANGTFQGAHRWNTRGGDVSWNLYLFTGSTNAPVFLNSGNTDASLNPNFSLVPGTNVIHFAGTSDRGIYVGLNLYFNNDLVTNRITAVVENNGTSSFSIVSTNVTTYGQTGNRGGSGMGSFTNNGWIATLIDFHTTLPRPDLVGATSLTPDSSTDTAGTFTLLVEEPPPPPPPPPPLPSTNYWQQAFGGDDDDVLSGVQQTADGGYFLGGFSRSDISGNKTKSNFGDYDYWLLKLNADGTNIWQRTYGGNDDDRCHSVKQTTNGGFIIGGYSYSLISGNKTAINRGGADYWVQRLDSEGNTVWEETYGGTAFDSLEAIELTSDGFVLGGYSYSGVSGNRTAANLGLNDFWLVRINTNGVPLWDKAFGGSADDLLRDMKATSDGGFILAGNSSSPVSGNKTSPHYGGNDGWIVRLDGNGNKLWEKSFGGTGADEISAVQRTSDGGYFLGGKSLSPVSGNKTSPNYGGSDGWVIRLNSDGDTLWQKSYGGSSSDAIVGVEEMRDGGFMLAGFSFSGVSGNKTNSSFGQNDWWTILVDSSGNILEQQSFGGSDYDELYSLAPTRTGGFLLGGYSTSGISGNKTNANFGLIDMWLVRVPSIYPPLLNIERTPAGRNVFWDIDYADWALQSTTNLLTANWGSVTEIPIQTNGYLSVSLSNLTSKAFFRLHGY